MPNPNRFLLTREGKKKLGEELQELRRLKAFKTRGESPRIFHSEDINPEFLAFQEDLDLLDTRILELESVLKDAQLIVPPAKEKQNVVSPGAMVTIEIGDEEDELEIVGSLEANPSLGRISSECPVGKSLLGKRVGDLVQVGTNPKIVYKIKKIKYQH
jgi:transcription elongation factor GreA